MPKIVYEQKRLNQAAQIIIRQANEIIDLYQDQGYDLTLRQLYYQFISRDLFPATWADPETGSTNNDRSYKKLGEIVSQGRRAGLIDWERIVDRTRNVRSPAWWRHPPSMVESCAEQFAVDWWANQAHRPEVWIEKDALVGVLEVACATWHCPYFSCRGYTSDSEIWSAGQRFARIIDNGQIPVVFHLGDHDPSGLDMTRDIRDRLRLFAGATVEVKRIALNIDQVEEHNPPPNPAKVTDARFAGYQAEFGDECWELDALNPETITDLIAGAMGEIVRQDEWDEAEERQAEGRRLLGEVARQWDKLIKKL